MHGRFTGTANLSERETGDSDLNSHKFLYFAHQQIDKWVDIATDWILLGSNLLGVHYEMMVVDMDKELDRWEV